MKLRANLLFLNSSFVINKLLQYINQKYKSEENTKIYVLDFHSVYYIDETGMNLLKYLITSCSKLELKLVFLNVSHDIHITFDSYDIRNIFDNNNIIETEEYIDVTRNIIFRGYMMECRINTQNY